VVHLWEGEAQRRDVVAVIALAKHAAEVLLVVHGAGVGGIREIGRVHRDTDDVLARRCGLRGVIEHEVLARERADVHVAPPHVNALVAVRRERPAGAVDPASRVDGWKKWLAVIHAEATLAREDRRAERAALEHGEQLVRRVMLVVEMVVAGRVLEEPIGVAEVPVVIRIGVRKRITDDRVGIADVRRAHREAKYAVQPRRDAVLDRRARSRFHVIAADGPRARDARGVDDEVREPIEIGNSVIALCGGIDAAGGDDRGEKEWHASKEPNESHSR
jgi:hypothetical protein